MMRRNKTTVCWNPELKKSKLNIFKNIFGVCFIWFIIFIFTFYMDGETGMILMYFALFSAVISYFTAFISRKRIKVSAECSEYVKKGNELSVKVKVEKTGKFPLAFVDLYTFSGETLGAEGKHFRLSLAFENSVEFEYKVKGIIGGNGKTGIKSVYSSGFFGFASYVSEVPQIIRNVGIIPEIPQSTTSNHLFRNVNDIVVTSDDDETDSPLAFSANSMAGYEHREYVEGDSLKRVNWKLSSKKNKLMVRLDEATSSVQPFVIADLSADSDGNMKKNALETEKTICSVISLVSLFVKQGISCKVCFKCENNDLKLFSAESEDSINSILMNMISVQPEKLAPFDESVFYTEGACAYIVFSNKVPVQLTESDFALSNRETTYFIVSDTDNIKNSSANLWHMNDDNNFEQVQ